MLPWNLLKSSNSFTSYLSAYSVFLSSIAGVMVSATVLRVIGSPRTNTDERQVTEYYFIRRGHYRVVDLYDPRKDGWYWYTYGVNLRAYAAYISGILINVVGFAGASAY